MRERAGCLPSRSRASTEALVALLLAAHERVIVGQRSPLEHNLVGLLANGRILIERVPGIGETFAVIALDPRPGPRRLLPADPVHPRPLAGRSVGHPRLPTTRGRFPGPEGPDLRRSAARRRDPPPPRSGTRCSRPSRRAGWRSAESSAPCRDPPSCSPDGRTRPRTRAPIPCPRRGSTVSCSSSSWIVPAPRRSSRSSPARRPTGRESKCRQSRQPTPCSPGGSRSTATISTRGSPTTSWISSAPTADPTAFDLELGPRIEDGGSLRATICLALAA